MFRSIFLSCLIYTSLIYSGGVISCIKESDAASEIIETIVDESIELLAKKLVSTALDRFDENSDIRTFITATGLKVKKQGNDAFALRINDKSIVTYKAGSEASEKDEFINKIGHVVLASIAKKKGLID